MTGGLKRALRAVFERLGAGKLLTVCILAVLAALSVYTYFSGSDVGNSGDSGIIIDTGNDAENASPGIAEADLKDAVSGVSDEASTPEPQAVIIVDVAGEVASPGVVELPAGSRVFQAIELAGGLTEDADTRYINQALVLSDGDKLYVPSDAETQSSAGITGGQGIASVVSGGQQSGRPGLININTASGAQLQTLNGIGPALAQRIIDYRESRGAFSSINDIKKVSGIGDKTFAKFKDRITV